MATGGGRRALAADVGSGLSSLALVTSVRSRSLRRLLLEGATQNLVHEGEGHPGVGPTVSVNGAPAGIGGKNIRRAGSVLGGEKVASWYDLTRREGAQPSLDELVEPDQVHVELQRRVRDEAVGAVRCLVTTGEVDEAEKRSDYEDSYSLPAGTLSSVLKI